VWGLDENFESQNPTQINLEELVEERDSKHFFYLVTIGIAIITLLISPIIKKLMGDVH